MLMNALKFELISNDYLINCNNIFLFVDLSLFSGKLNRITKIIRTSALVIVYLSSYAISKQKKL